MLRGIQHDVSIAGIGYRDLRTIRTFSDILHARLGESRLDMLDRRNEIATFLDPFVSMADLVGFQDSMFLLMVSLDPIDVFV